MPGLNATLSVAVQALLAEQGAMNTTANNVANANTPGYSRQRPILAEADPVMLGNLTFGSGVSLQKIESIRDPVLQLRIQQETQQQSALDTFVSSMQQVQVLFNGTSGSDIGAQISSLFSSISQLSADPTNLALRQGVLTAAGNLANAFHHASTSLAEQRSALDTNVEQTVASVNTLTAQIAKLNSTISGIQGLHLEAGTFIDQRDALINQLSSLVDVAEIRNESGITLTTSNGTALVVGDKSFDLTTQVGASGIQHVFSQGIDITGKLVSGQLAGLLQVRDQSIPGLLTDLDTLAAGLANAFNAANQSGSDLNGTAGGDFFVPPPASGVGAAANLALAISDPTLVAASSDGSPGSNGNLVAFSAVHDQPVAGGQTPLDFYSGIVFRLGNDISSGSAELSASQLTVNQLQDQRGSISGVSLDEEAANLLRFQQAYSAAARVVTTVSDMMDTVINMVP